MAAPRIAVLVRNAMLDALLARLNLGAGPATLKIYSGTQPANGDTALSGNTLLGTLTFSDPAAPAADGGVLTFEPLTQELAADATATATWGRVQDSDGNNVLDGSCGTTLAFVIQINTTSIEEGGPIQVTSFTITIPA